MSSPRSPRRLAPPARAALLAAALAIGLARPAPADEPRPLLEERFADPAALEGWQRADGAGGGEPASAASLDGGALLLAGDGATRRWLAITRAVPLAGARWIRVSARVRTEDVTPEGARFRNCDVFVRFPGGPIAATRVLTGSNAWTPLARRLRVPAGAESATVGCFLSMPGRAWFTDVRVDAVPDPAWREEAAGRFVYRTLPGDAVPEAARRYNDESLRIAEEFLGVTRTARVVFWKYPDLDAKEEYTGTRGNAIVIGGEVHSIWATDRHEVVHVLAPAWGDPPALLGEGLAVYISGAWQGQPVRAAAAAVRAPPLGAILETGAFRALPDEVSYPVAGAFVEWIVAAHGKEALRRLYGALKNGAGAAENARALEAGLGAGADEIDAAFRAWLRAAR
jgi:hypothetical protein